MPSGDHIARVAVRLLGTVAELRKRLGDSVQAGEVVAVIESREVADAKSEYLAARLVFDLQQTLFDRSKMLFERKFLSENDFLRARTTFEDARVKHEIARQRNFSRAHRPDMQVMHQDNADTFFEVAAYGTGINAGRDSIERHRHAVAKQVPGAPYDHCADHEAGGRVESRPTG